MNSAAEKAKREEIMRDEEAGDLRWLMGSKRGRRIVQRLLDWAGVYRSSWSPNALEMAHNEGHRNYGCRMLATVTANCPDLYVLLLKEHKAKKRDSDPSRGADSGTGSD